MKPNAMILSVSYSIKALTLGTMRISVHVMKVYGKYTGQECTHTRRNLMCNLSKCACAEFKNCARGCMRMSRISVISSGWRWKMILRWDRIGTAYNSYRAQQTQFESTVGLQPVFRQNSLPLVLVLREGLRASVCYGNMERLSVRNCIVYA